MQAAVGMVRGYHGKYQVCYTPSECTRLTELVALSQRKLWLEEFEPAEGNTKIAKHQPNALHQLNWSQYHKKS